MRIAVLLARILLGAVFLVHGLNIFFQFFPLPPPPPGPVENFVGALFDSGYFFWFLGAMEAICGLLLLVGLYVPLALTMLAPILLHILAFHVFLAPSGLVFALVLVGLEVFLAVAYRDAFRAMLDRHAEPKVHLKAPGVATPGKRRYPPDLREPSEA